MDLPQVLDKSSNTLFEPYPASAIYYNPFENVIRPDLIISLFERTKGNNKERQILSLPVKLVGMGITNITSISDIEY